MWPSRPHTAMPAGTGRYLRGMRRCTRVAKSRARQAPVRRCYVTRGPLRSALLLGLGPLGLGPWARRMALPALAVAVCISISVAVWVIVFVLHQRCVHSGCGFVWCGPARGHAPYTSHIQLISRLPQPPQTPQSPSRTRIAVSKSLVSETNIAFFCSHIHSHQFIHLHIASPFCSDK